MSETTQKSGNIDTNNGVETNVKNEDLDLQGPNALETEDAKKIEDADILKKASIEHVENEVQQKSAFLKQSFEGAVMQNAIKNGKGYEDLLALFTEVTLDKEASEANLKALLLGQMMQEVSQTDDEEEKLQIMQKYMTLAGVELDVNPALDELMQRVKLREMEGAEGRKRKDSIGQIVSARGEIRTDLQVMTEAEIQDKYDSRLIPLMQTWKMGKEAFMKLSPAQKKEYQQILAEVLSGKVTGNMLKKYQEKGKLRDQTYALTEKAYEHAHQSIAYEVYGWIKESPEVENAQKEIDDLILDLTQLPNRKKAQFITDLRTLKEKAADENPAGWLDPGNLLRLALTIWGGGLALMNAIASKGDVLNNEYFWAGLGTAYVAGNEWRGNKMITGREIHKQLYLLKLAKKSRPFKNAEKIDMNGDGHPERLEIERMDLHEYIRKNPKEISELKKKFGESPDQKMRNIIRDNKRTILLNPLPGDKPDKKRRIYGIADGLKDDVTEESGKNGKLIRDGYERYLFYKALDNIGIGNKASLENLLGVMEMQGGVESEELGVESGSNVLKGEALLNNSDFRNGLDKVADNLGIQANWLTQIMQKESGVDPSNINKITGATGLIQFMPKTAIELGTTTEELAKMSGVQQLKYVNDYYMQFKNKLPHVKGAEDLYVLTFYPEAMGRGDNFVLGSEDGAKISPEKIAKDNHGLGDNSRTFLTLRDVRTFFKGELTA